MTYMNEPPLQTWVSELDGAVTCDASMSPESSTFNPLVQVPVMVKLFPLLNTLAASGELMVGGFNDPLKRTHCKPMEPEVFPLMSV